MLNSAHMSLDENYLHVARPVRALMDATVVLGNTVVRVHPEHGEWVPIAHVLETDRRAKTLGRTYDRVNAEYTAHLASQVLRCVVEGKASEHGARLLVPDFDGRMRPLTKTRFPDLHRKLVRRGWTLHKRGEDGNWSYGVWRAPSEKLITIEPGSYRLR